MRLTVLGNAAAYLAPLSGGSSYLVETDDGARILLDAGQGAREALAAARIDRLDAIWISHMHFDHVLDLPVLSPLHEDVPILLPRGERRRLDALAEAYVWGRSFDVGDVREVEEGERFELAGLRWSFARTKHSAPALALRLEGDAASLVYASDSAPCEPLLQLARGADLLLMHALLADVDPASHHAQVHSTGRTAGALAADAGARELLLSHRFHGTDDADMLREARASHTSVALARTGMTRAVASDAVRR